MKQLSMMPDEKPDKEIKESHPAYKSLKSKCQSLFAKCDAYEYCKIAMQVKSMDDGYSNRVYSMTSKDAFTVFNTVFTEAVAFQDNIESFLKNVAAIPGYAIKKVETKK